MKKIITILLIWTLCTALQAQEQTFKSYYTLSTGLSSMNDKTISLEVGCWGIDKPVMYGISADFVNQTDFWVAIKPYYQLTEGKGYYLFTYFSPKFNVNNLEDHLIEYGLMNYTKVTESFYTSFGVGFQSAKEYNHIPSIMFGINLVL